MWPFSSKKEKVEVLSLDQIKHEARTLDRVWQELEELTTKQILATVEVQSLCEEFSQALRRGATTAEIPLSRWTIWSRRKDYALLVADELTWQGFPTCIRNDYGDYTLIIDLRGIPDA
jgi:hypothetical protein